MIKNFDRQNYDNFDEQGKKLCKDLFIDIFGLKFNKENETESTGVNDYWDLNFVIPEDWPPPELSPDMVNAIIKTLTIPPETTPRRNIVVEVEVKKYWFFDKEGNLSFPTLHIPWRKKKNKADLFVVANSNGKSYYIVKKVIADKKCLNPRIKDTRMQSNDEFYEIDVKDCVIFKINR